MKFEFKVIILSLLFSFLCIGLFTYVSSIGQKTYYVYQVGIYKEEKNKDSKMNELQDEGYEGYFYKKDNQYYVISMITEKKEDIEKHSQKLKGIIKKYVVSKDTTYQQLLKELEKGINND